MLIFKQKQSKDIVNTFLNQLKRKRPLFKYSLNILIYAFSNGKGAPVLKVNSFSSYDTNQL